MSAAGEQVHTLPPSKDIQGQMRKEVTESRHSRF